MSQKVAAIILAAGLSTRMGAFKPLLPLGPETIVERCLRLFREAGLRDLLVVTGHRRQELEPVVVAAGGRPIFNPRYKTDMFSSVQAGVASLPSSCVGFFLLPVDTPLVRPYTVVSLLQSFRTADPRVLHPVFQGRRGHPPLITSDLVGAIAAWGGERGLAGLLAQRPELALEVEVPDRNILFDLDHPYSYRRALARLKRLDIPSRLECEVMLTQAHACGPRGLAHARAVTREALRLARALNRCRSARERLNLALVQSAALLHDLAKGQPEHERRSGESLSEMGFPAVGEIVARHHEVCLGEGEPIKEREIVFLADKLVQGSEPVTLEGRFNHQMTRFADDPQTVEDLRRRLAQAQWLRACYEQEAGVAPEAGRREEPR